MADWKALLRHQDIRFLKYDVYFQLKYTGIKLRIFSRKYNSLNTHSILPALNKINNIPISQEL